MDTKQFRFLCSEHEGLLIPMFMCSWCIPCVPNMGTWRTPHSMIQLMVCSECYPPQMTVNINSCSHACDEGEGGSPSGEWSFPSHLENSPQPRSRSTKHTAMQPSTLRMRLASRERLLHSLGSKLIDTSAQMVPFVTKFVRRFSLLKCCGSVPLV